MNLCVVSLTVLSFSNSNCQSDATSNLSDVRSSNDNNNITNNNNLSVSSGNTANTPIRALLHYPLHLRRRGWSL